MKDNAHEITTADGEIKRADLETRPLPELYLRTPFNYDRDYASLASGLTCLDPTRAQQQFKEDTDINTLVERYHLTGEIPQNIRVPLPPEFIEATDYQQAQNLLIEADQAFMAMPANVRKEFDNDPARFLEFVHDDRNRDRAQQLGIVNLPEPKTPPATPADPPAAA